MIINKIVQSLAKNFSAEWEIRPTLSSVFFTKNKAVATDSFKLCEIEFLQNEFTQEDLEFKNFEYKKYDESFLINKNSFLELQIPKIKDSEKLNKIYIWRNLENEIEFKSFDAEKEEQTIKAKQRSGQFPDYEWFFKNDWTLQIWVNVEMLDQLIQIYKDAKVSHVKMTLWTNMQPLMFEAIDSKDKLKNNDIKQIKSLLMPIKL